MRLEVLGHERLQQGVLVAQHHLIEQDPARGLGLIERPGVHRGDEGVPVDEIHLQARIPNSKLRSESAVAMTDRPRVPRPRRDRSARPVASSQ